MMSDVTSWLHPLAVVALTLAVGSVLVMIIDIAVGHPQQMWIMNVVWPATGLWAGPLALSAYYTLGRRSTRRAMQQAKSEGKPPPGERRPFPLSVALAATHCGSGCTLGDLIAEWFVFFVPLTLAGETVLGTWLLDYAMAFLLGIAFQYFTIVPMRKLSPGRGLWAAVKADALSLTAWQVGMYGWMALVIFVWFGDIPKTSPVFWFMMQLAMGAGFLTSYPANWWLLRSGTKEIM